MTVESRLSDFASCGIVDCLPASSTQMDTPAHCDKAKTLTIFVNGRAPPSNTYYDSVALTMPRPNPWMGHCTPTWAGFTPRVANAGERLGTASSMAKHSVVRPTINGMMSVRWLG